MDRVLVRLERKGAADYVESMAIRRRSFRSFAAVAALLVSWTVGPGAAFCVAEEMGPADDGHGAHAMASGHGSHGMHHAPPPEPARGEHPPVDAPDCPWMAMSGGACLVAAAPAIAPAPAMGPPRAEYPHPEAVRDQLLAGAYFRPPKA